MQMLLIFNSDNRPFDIDAVQHAFESDGHFRDVRFNEPGGALVEAKCIDDGDATFVRLSSDRKTITLSRETETALRAAFELRQRLTGPLRIIDMDYAFDFALDDFAAADDLRAAILKAQGG